MDSIFCEVKMVEVLPRFPALGMGMPYEISFESAKNKKMRTVIRTKNVRRRC